MKGLRTLLDTFTGVMYLVGPGGYELRLSPGSEKHDLQESGMGHLMLPCSTFGPHNGRTFDETMNFVVGDFFAAEATESGRKTDKDAHTWVVPDSVSPSASRTQCVDNEWIDNLIEEVAAPFGDISRRGLHPTSQSVSS